MDPCAENRGLVQSLVRLGSSKAPEECRTLRPPVDMRENRLVNGIQVRIISLEPYVSIAVAFWGYLMGSSLDNWLNHENNYNGDYKYRQKTVNPKP